LATGFWSGIEDLKKNWAEDRTFTPAMREYNRAELYSGWKKAIEKSLSWK
ncbi:MAG: hypothetical protein GY760_26225, partial [Deltaproteobacteria bacterium]|nr:hypothetical protein [Deltaproteobacteria bacterium]